MNIELLKIINKEIEEGKSGVLCTVIRAVGSTPRDIGASMWVRADGSTIGTVGGGPSEKEVIDKANEMIKKGEIEPKIYEAVLREKESEGKSICGGEISVLLEPLGNEPKIVIFGAGHVGKALARVASITGFKTIVWDDREDLANQQNISWTETIICSLDEAIKKINFDKNTYVVVLTRQHSLDEDVVRLLEGKSFAYLGVIGSLRKTLKMKENLLKRGVSKSYVDKIYQPIGIPIGAETPEEIAISILAEIIAAYRKTNISVLRNTYSIKEKSLNEI